MIIRPHCTTRYVVLPNSLLADRRLSIETRGMLALLLSKARSWQLRPRPLMKELSREGETGFGRTRLQRMLDEAMAAGYVARPEKQGHEKDGRWGKYEYIVGMPDDVLRAVQKSDVAFAPQSRDPHVALPRAQNDFTNHKVKSPPNNKYKNSPDRSGLPLVLGNSLKRLSNARGKRGRLLVGKEVFQNQLAVRLGAGDAAAGWLMLAELSDARRDELTARERLGRLSDEEVANVIASISLRKAKGAQR